MVVESWWASLRSGTSTSLFNSEGLLLFCADFPPLGNSLLMEDLQTWRQNGICFAEEGLQPGSSSHTHLFIQAASGQVTPTTNNSGCSWYKEEFIPDGALSEEEFVPGFSWIHIPGGGGGTQLLWLPQEKEDTEECLAENQLLLLPKCKFLMCLLRPLLMIQQVKRQYCFLPEGLVWEHECNYFTQKQKGSLCFSSIPSVRKLFATIRKVEQWGGVTASTALVLANREKNE